MSGGGGYISFLVLPLACLANDFTPHRNTIVTFEKEQDANKKAFEKIRAFADEVLRERDIVRKDLQRASRTIGEQAEVILTHTQHIKQLDVEIKQHLEAAQKQRSILAKVEKERDKNAEDAQVLSDKLEQCQGEIDAKYSALNISIVSFGSLRTAAASQMTCWPRRSTLHSSTKRSRR